LVILFRIQIKKICSLLNDVFKEKKLERLIIVNRNNKKN
jgi:hypothetical protein